jgi:hypothetical protein
MRTMAQLTAAAAAVVFIAGLIVGVIAMDLDGSSRRGTASAAIRPENATTLPLVQIPGSVGRLPSLRRATARAHVTGGSTSATTGVSAVLESTPSLAESSSAPASSSAAPRATHSDSTAKGGAAAHEESGGGA